MPGSRQRLYAALLALGISILLTRTIVMLAGGAAAILAPWAAALLVMELLLDLGAVLAALRWLTTGRQDHAALALSLAAAAILLHALRVLVFVLGRTGPWIDFDVRSEHRALHPERWSWAEVHFAATMAALSIVGALAVWRWRRRKSP